MALGTRLAQEAYTSASLLFVLYFTGIEGGPAETEGKTGRAFDGTAISGSQLLTWAEDRRVVMRGRTSLATASCLKCYALQARLRSVICSCVLCIRDRAAASTVAERRANSMQAEREN